MRERIIIYDLKDAESSDYDHIIDVLKDFNCVALNKSCYVIRTEKSQFDIEQTIKKNIKKDDKVYFISVDSNNKLFYKKIISNN